MKKKIKFFLLIFIIFTAFYLLLFHKTDAYAGKYSSLDNGYLTLQLNKDHTFELIYAMNKDFASSKGKYEISDNSIDLILVSGNSNSDVVGKVKGSKIELYNLDKNKTFTFIKQ